MEAARKELEAALGRPPRPEELADQARHPARPDSTSIVGEATAVSLVSLNKKWYETDSYKDVREIDILEDKKAEDPTGRLQNRDLMQLVTRGLNRNERLIVILYYYEEMTMKEIGATLEPERVAASARCTRASSPASRPTSPSARASSTTDRPPSGADRELMHIEAG